MKKLKEDGFLAVATIRKDRMKDADKNLLSEKELKKGRGSSDYLVEANTGVTVVKWFGNSVVQLISNYVGKDLGDQCRRYNKKHRQFVYMYGPLMVQIYNKHMGGVDL